MRFLVTLNMPSRKGELVHQIVCRYPVDSIEGFLEVINESDFIFTVAAEELGLLGALLVIGLLAVVCGRGVLIARRAPDLFGRCLAAGVVAWFAFQGFENIGMNVGIMPITGVPLPFVSYGGTSMFASWIALGLLENVRLHQQQQL